MLPISPNSNEFCLNLETMRQTLEVKLVSFVLYWYVPHVFDLLNICITRLYISSTRLSHFVSPQRLTVVDVDRWISLKWLTQRLPRHGLVALKW